MIAIQLVDNAMMPPRIGGSRNARMFMYSLFSCIIAEAKEVFIIKNLTTRAGLRTIIDRYGIQTRKKLGQHFLVDPHVVDKIIYAADLSMDDCVLEIGPGPGGLTQAMLGYAGHIIAVELDKQLIPVLTDLFAGPNFTLVQGDILKVNLSEILAPHTGRPIKVVANLPYYITTPVILYLLESGLPFESITVMVQKEVAKRMAASPGTKDYGSLTLAVGYYADVSLVANVPVNSFMPRPAVDSAVVKLVPRPAPVVAADKTQLFDVIHAAFNQRRKTLVNGLSSGLKMDKNHVADVLISCGFKPEVRGETLDMASFARIADKIFS